MALNRKLSDKPLASSYSADARIHIYEPNDFSQAPSGSDYQLPANLITDQNALHKTGSETAQGIKTWQDLGIFENGINLKAGADYGGLTYSFGGGIEFTENGDTIFSIGGDGIFGYNYGGSAGLFNFTNLTDSRQYFMPDLSGTVALLETAIPRAGTGSGDAVYGNVELAGGGSDIRFFQNQGDAVKFISFADDETILMQVTNTVTGDYCNYTLSSQGMQLVTNALTSKGFNASSDFSANYDDLTYVQKIWVDNQLSNKADLVSGLIPSSQIPATVDEILEYSNLASFPATGESNKYYLDLATNKTYRWSGSVYVAINEGIALGETSSTAYRGDRGKTAYDHSQSTGNPHSTTKSDIGLSNVDNTSDADKPVSTAQVTAIGLKEDSANKSTTTADSASTSKFPVWSAIVSYFSASQIRSILGISTLSGSNTGDQDLSGLMVKSNNLSDLTNTTIARTNLGLGTLATQNGTYTNDYTTAEKTKLAGIATGATANSSDATLLNRVNHTGTQTASTISDFSASVLNLVLAKFKSVYTWTLTTATGGVWEGTTGAGAGTYTTALPTDTNLYTSMKRARYANVVTTTNQVLGQRNTEAIFFRGSAVSGAGGFKFFARGGFDVWTNGGRFFAGMASATTVVSANPSLLANTVGFAVDDTDNGLIYFITRDATTVTRVSTGLTIVSNKGYDFKIECSAGGTSYTWSITDINTGTTASGTATSTLPVNNTKLTANFLASNGALTTVTAIQLGLTKMTIETDY